jgi:hypothetical protein
VLERAVRVERLPDVGCVDREMGQNYR